LGDNPEHKTLTNDLRDWAACWAKFGMVHCCVINARDRLAKDIATIQAYAWRRLPSCYSLWTAIDGVVGAVFSWSERGVPMPPNGKSFLGACAMREGARAANLRHHPLTTAGATPRRQPWRLLGAYKTPTIRDTIPGITLGMISVTTLCIILDTISCIISGIILVFISGIIPGTIWEMIGMPIADSVWVIIDGKLW
jgi:hypothetical protein